MPSFQNVKPEPQIQVCFRYLSWKSFHSKQHSENGQKASSRSQPMKPQNAIFGEFDWSRNLTAWKEIEYFGVMSGQGGQTTGRDSLPYKFNEKKC